MVRVMVGFPNCDIQEFPSVSIQEVVHVGHPLLVLPDYDTCQAVLCPPPLLEVGVYVLRPLSHSYRHEVLAALSIFHMGEVGIDIPN